MAAKKQVLKKTGKSDQHNERLDVRPTHLLAATAYMTDIVPNGCYYHSWRTALVAEHLASTLIADEAGDVFYAGLMQDVGTVGAHKHITQYTSLQMQLDDRLIQSHPRRGAALLDWLPGMSAAAKLARSHHEWWDGRGYPDSKVALEIPTGSQLLLLADTLDMAGCFASKAALAEGRRKLAIFTGHAWSKEAWAALHSSTEDADFYASLMDQSALQGMISDRLAKHPLPAGLDSSGGVERVFHIFSAVIDAKDPSTAGHSLRTAKFARSLAEHMSLSKTDIQIAYWAGLVHDCGRLGVPTLILKRSGRLNEEEMTLVRKHAQMTMRVMNCMPDCPAMGAIGEIAGHDHERFDGTGYPDRLAGENIPLLSRILSVSDAFDAMTSPTSYKHLLSPRFAVIRLKQAAGAQFDPKMVEAMTGAVEAGVFDVEQQDEAA